MQRFNDTILDRFGNPAAGVSVYVYQAGSSTTLATIYDPSENNIDPVNEISNPLVTDATGRVSFAVVNGRYRIVYTGGNITNRQMDWVALIDGSGGYVARCWRNSARAADTLNVAPFLHFVDCHYQSTGIPTKQRNGPDFWT